MIVLLWVALLVLTPGLVLAADTAGSSDYPSIGRYEGSEISKYRVEDYGETVFATGPVKSQRDAESTTLRKEGRVTRIVYRVPPGVSALEVFRNFQSRIEVAGFEEIFAGGPDEIDSYNFRYKHPVEVLEVVSVSGKIYYLSARKTVSDRETYISVLVSPHSGGDGQRVRLIALEAKAMEERMIDADAMQTAIADTGRVALYGIYFDTDSAEVKPGSDPTLEEIAELMTASQGLKIIVVGHTDIEGGYEYNIDLSRRRAEAVAKALIGTYGISAQRVGSAGVGYLAPAASNESTEGRALNRRVELVKDK